MTAPDTPEEREPGTQKINGPRGYRWHDDRCGRKYGYPFRAMKGTISTDSDAEVVIVDLIEDSDSTSACEGCGLRHHCSLPGQKRVIFSRHEISGEFHPGEKVEVDVPPAVVILLSISVYVVPVVFMLAFAFVGARVGEWISVLAGLGGLGFGLLLNMILNRTIPISRILSVKKEC